MRLRTLDLIRGVAVLGILAVNIANFASPDSATVSPDLPHPGTTADHWAFAATLVFFEGKMRALFSMLFGASLLLFVDRQDHAGRSGTALQVRRLAWLAVFGYLHFALLWDGDILFLYACVGLGALLLRGSTPLPMAMTAVLLFTVWQSWGAATWLPSVMIEAQVAANTATASEQRDHAAQIAGRRATDAQDAADTLAPLGGEIDARLTSNAAYPLEVVAYNWGETLSYVLIGMALLRSGFLSGAWPRRRVCLLAVGGLGAGLVPTLAFAAWAQAHHYPEFAMHMMLSYGLAFPHLLMALGYAAALVLAAPWLLRTRIGQRIEAAGRTAFSNYLGTTLIMTGIFSGWGLGLFGRFGAAALWPFVLLGWGLMLAWPVRWLARYRMGPLEWLWRSLTERRLMPFRRTIAIARNSH
ncbi:MAG: DUF418 domain-containing protein [Proteobacteria bacterium]|nr:DUF418 domain-containing protein [Pseudomonadota bacterium]